MKKNRNSGFTLLELAIALVVVGLLATIAYPTYLEAVRKTRRSDAKVALLRIAQVLERCYIEYNAYNDSNCAAVDNSDNTKLAGGYSASDEGYYTLSESSSKALLADSFAFKATPAGVQTGDRCGSFTYDHLGTKGVTGDADGNGTGGESADVALCW